MFDPFTAPTESGIDLLSLAQAVATIDEAADCGAVAPLRVDGVRMVDAPADTGEVDAGAGSAEVVRIAAGCLLVEYAALDGRTVDEVRDLLAVDGSVYAVGISPRGVRSTHDNGAHARHTDGHAAITGKQLKDDGTAEVITGEDLWHLPQPDYENLWDAWDASRSVMVAVLDTGVDVTHPDLKNQIVDDTLGKCHDRDDKPHGTGVAGVVAAERGNGGVIGVAPSAKILPIKVRNNDDTKCKTDMRVTEGIAEAVNRGADVINMSFVWRGPFTDTGIHYVGGVPIQLAGTNILNEDRGATGDTFELAIRAASMLGIILVNSAGNCGDPSDLERCKETHNEYKAPARYRDVIAVANIQKDGMRYVSSTYNDYVELAAPGSDIWVPVPSPKGSYGAGDTAADALYERVYGTSFAAPFVSGVVAHMLNRHPEATPGQVRKALHQTANRTRIKPSAPQQVPDPKFGYGIVESAAAVERLGEILEDLEASGSEGGFEAVSAGERHTCGLRESGLVRCWGVRAVRDVPDFEFAALSSPPRGDFVCGVRAADSGLDGGAVVCWGDLPSGVRAVAAPRSYGGAVRGYTQVSAGSGHVCALRDDEYVVCWGDAGFGQTDAPVRGYSGVQSGERHSCALSKRFGENGGDAVCWGDYKRGQLKVPSPAGPWHSVAAGRWHNCGVRLDRSVECWGQGRGEGDVGLGGDWVAPPGGEFSLVPLALGARHSCGVRPGGTAVCWGDDTHGQSSPPQGEFVSLSAGARHTCGVLNGGGVRCWGSNADGQAPRAGLAGLRVLAGGEDLLSGEFERDTTSYQVTSPGGHVRVVAVTAGASHGSGPRVTITPGDADTARIGHQVNVAGAASAR